MVRSPKERRTSENSVKAKFAEPSLRAIQERSQGTVDSHTLTRYDRCLSSYSALVRQEEEGGLARELEALETGWRLGMHDSD